MGTTMLITIWMALGADPAAISTIAGTGEKGYAGDGGPATRAQLNQPFHCDLDGTGNLYIAEALNHCIRKVDLKTGVLTTIAGTGQKGYTGDGGPARQATFNEPYAVVVDGNGDLYIVDRLNAVIRKVDGKTGVITTVAERGRALPPSGQWLPNWPGVPMAALGVVSPGCWMLTNSARPSPDSAMPVISQSFGPTRKRRRPSRCQTSRPSEIRAAAIRCLSVPTSPSTGRSAMHNRSSSQTVAPSVMRPGGPE